jgi:ligand-binding sensor domain-containing protein
MCFSFVGIAQNPFGVTLDKTKGLPSNKVYEIFEDSKGYIWITSEEGLARFDGYKFKNYSYDNQFSKAGNNLQEDKYGRIWYVTFDNYIYYTENDSLKLFNKKPGINSFSTILENNLFFIQLDKIDVYSIETFKHVKSLKIKTENLSAVAKIENQLYIAFDSLICVLNVKGEITHQYIIQLNGELITYISKFNDQVYIDKFDNVNQAAGTTVKIIIPI